MALKHVNSFPSKGKMYHYFRHRGVNERLPDDPSSPEFMEAYARLLRAHTSGSAAATVERYAYGTINWLIWKYKSSPSFADLTKNTQSAYARLLENYREIGTHPANKVQRKHIQAMRERYRDRLRTADEFAKVSSILFGFGVDFGVVEHNPAERMKRWNKSNPYRRWTAQELADFEATCPDGPMRTAFMVALYTGQRRGDVLSLTWDKYTGTHIIVRQSKTGVALKIPVHSDLTAYLDGLDRKSPDGKITLMIVPSKTGKRWDVSAFRRAFRSALDASGLGSDVQFHGLRKNTASLLAEAGCTQHEIQAITGHKTSEMVSHYTEEADREIMSSAAIKKFEARNK